MSFLYPAFLIGALAIAVPIVLHLLRRDVAPDVPFSAVRLLQKSAVEQSRRRHLKDLLLLAARVAALLLLAFAFARPYIGSAAPATLRIVALDRSYSMGGAARFEAARQLAAAAIDDGARGQRVALVAFDSRPEVLAEPGDAAAARDALRTVQPGFGATRYGPLFDRAAEIAAGAAGELVIVTDLQQAGWDERVPASLPTGWRVDVRAVAPLAENVAVTAVSVEEQRLVASIRNGGMSDRSGRVSVALDGRPAAAADYQVAPGATVHVPIAWRAPRTGALSVSLEDPDGLSADNSRHVILGGVSAAKALVVAGGVRGGLYLARALEAPAAADGHLEVEVVDGSALSAMTADQLQAHPVVALLTTRSVERRSWETISAHVRAGAGLFVAAGPDVDPSVLSSLTAWQPALTIAEEAMSQVTLSATDPRHPIFRPFGALAANLGQPAFARAWRVGADGWSVIARFSNGAPALLERPLDRGRVVLFASDVDRRWNELPLHPAFVPFALETVRYAAGTRRSPQEFTIGEEPAGTGPGPGVFRRPDGRAAAINVDPGEGDLRRLDRDVLGQAVGRTADGAAPAARQAQQAEAHQSFWQYGLLLMIAALVAESFVGRS